MNEKTLDVRGMKCPIPIVKAKRELIALAAGERLKVVATDRGSLLDFRGWAKQNPKFFHLVEQHEEKDEAGRDVFVHLLEKGS